MPISQCIRIRIFHENIFIPGFPKNASPKIKKKKIFSQKVTVREWKKICVVKGNIIKLKKKYSGKKSDTYSI